MASTEDLLGRCAQRATRNREREHVVVTEFRPRRSRRRQSGKPGAGMIASATGLLFLLGAGLLAVSLAAQYAYLVRQRHQHAASLIEALALDLGMLIFSLLALGLARSGKPARPERALIVVCAVGSALMNLAAADLASPRSALAFTMPPLFLAVVADRVISVVRRHYLENDGQSAWSAAARAMSGPLRAGGLSALYLLRLAVAPASTVRGARQVLLHATPLSGREVPPALQAAAPPALTTGRSGLPKRARRGKTAAFLSLVEQRYGPLSGFELSKVGRVAAELAPEADLHPGSARAALRAAVIEAQRSGGAS